MLSNLKSQMRKGLIEYCILAIISRDEAYASDILEKLKVAQLVVVELELLRLHLKLRLKLIYLANKLYFVADFVL